MQEIEIVSNYNTLGKSTFVDVTNIASPFTVYVSSNLTGGGFELTVEGSYDGTEEGSFILNTGTAIGGSTLSFRSLSAQSTSTTVINIAVVSIRVNLISNDNANRTFDVYVVGNSDINTTSTSRVNYNSLSALNLTDSSFAGLLPYEAYNLIGDNMTTDSLLTLTNMSVTNYPNLYVIIFGSNQGVGNFNQTRRLGEVSMLRNSNGAIAQTDFFPLPLTATDNIVYNTVITYVNSIQKANGQYLSGTILNTQYTAYDIKYEQSTVGGGLNVANNNISNLGVLTRSIANTGESFSQRQINNTLFPIPPTTQAWQNIYDKVKNILTIQNIYQLYDVPSIGAFPSLYAYTKNPTESMTFKVNGGNAFGIENRKVLEISYTQPIPPTNTITPSIPITYKTYWKEGMPVEPVTEDSWIVEGGSSYSFSQVYITDADFAVLADLRAMLNFLVTKIPVPGSTLYFVLGTAPTYFYKFLPSSTPVSGGLYDITYSGLFTFRNINNIGVNADTQVWAGNAKLYKALGGLWYSSTYTRV